MTLEYVPLLNVQRDLYDHPRGFERFREYIQTMTGGGDELKLLLVAVNPMGKDHLPRFLDHLLAIDADGVGARALADAAASLADERGDYCACLVVSDDLKGGWTNRYASEFTYRATDRATLIAALFGDVAARDLGYQPLGLSPRAGLALAAAGL